MSIREDSPSVKRWRQWRSESPDNQLHFIEWRQLKRKEAQTALLNEVRKALEFYQANDNNSQSHLDRIVAARNAIAQAEEDL